MATSWWSKVLRRAPTLPPRRRCANVRVSLECLEDRTLPAVDPLWALMLYPALSPATAANLLSPTVNAAVDQAAIQSASQTGQTPGAGSITGTTTGSTTPSTGGSPQGPTSGIGASTGSSSTPRPSPPQTSNDRVPAAGQNPTQGSNPNSTQNANQNANQQTADANAAAASATMGGDGTTLQSMTDSDAKDFDPNLGAVLSRILSSPLLGSGVLAAFAVGRMEGFRQSAVVVVDDPAPLSAAPLPANGPGSGAPGGGSTAANAVINESATGTPSRASFTTDPALALSSFASSTGALRFQGIDFRPVNSSGVGVVGTVLAGVDGANAEGHPGAAGVQQAVAPGAAAASHAPPAYDAALKKFLLGLDSPASAVPGSADARIPQAPVPAGVGRGPVRVEGAAAFDDVFAGGPEAEDGDDNDDTEGRGGLVVLLAAPLVYLHWFPGGRSRRKKLPGPDLAEASARPSLEGRPSRDPAGQDL